MSCALLRQISIQREAAVRSSSAYSLPSPWDRILSTPPWTSFEEVDCYRSRSQTYPKQFHPNRLISDFLPCNELNQLGQLTSYVLLSLDIDNAWLVLLRKVFVLRLILQIIERVFLDLILLALVADELHVRHCFLRIQLCVRASNLYLSAIDQSQSNSRKLRLEIKQRLTILLAPSLYT